VRRPGSSLLNPALSVILDGYVGYYGKSRADFEALKLPVAGDDPSASRESFGVQEVEFAASAAIDPYLEGAMFLTIPNLDGIEVEEAYFRCVPRAAMQRMTRHVGVSLHSRDGKCTGRRKFSSDC
jgi:hypothetical protein